MAKAFYMRKKRKRQDAKGCAVAGGTKSLDGSKGALLYGVTRLPRSASCGAWMPVQTVILCVTLLRTRGCTPCDATHLSLHNHERKPFVYQLAPSHGFLLSLHVLLDNTVRMGYNHMNFL